MVIWCGLGLLDARLVGIALHLWVWVVLHMLAHACLRLLQLLRAPSALQDAQALHAALRGRPQPRPFFAIRWLPPVKLEKLYFLARHRFFIDEWVYRCVIAPVLHIGQACDGFEQAVFLNGRGEPTTERGGVAFLYSARAASVIVLGIALGLSLRCLQGQTVMLVPGVLAIDEVSALYLPLALLVACVSLFAAPARELSTRSLGSLGAALFGSIIAFAAQGLGVFVLGWLVSLCGIGWALPPGGKLRRTYWAYAALGTLPLLAALLILAPLSLTSFVSSTAPTRALSLGAEHSVFLLLATAAAFRSGLFPLHSWLPALCQRAPVSVSSLVFGAQLGPVLVARAFGPLTPNVAQHDMSTFATWALASAVFTALLGLVQRDIKRSLGFVLGSQSSLLLFGLCDNALEARHGALLGALAVGLTGSGLLLTAALLADREQTSDVGVLEGRGLRYPRLTALFFLLACAAIGLPGSLHFVAEDLLLHGLLHVHPRLAIVLLLVGVFNGVCLLRLFFTVFQGPARVRPVPQAPDLPLRQAAILSGLLLASMFAGLAPAWLLTLQERSLHVREVDRGGYVHTAHAQSVRPRTLRTQTRP